MKNIFTIAKKELQSYFNNPTAYVIVLVFLLLWEFLFFRSVFLIGEASLRGLFEILPLILMVIVPALTMGSIAEEKRDGTLEFLLTHPLNQLELIVGKFLGILSFFAIIFVFILPLAWSLSQFGNLDFGEVISQYLASVLMTAVLIGLGIFISSFFSSQISAFLVSTVASFFLVVSGTELVSARLPLWLAPFIEQFSLSNHFNSMSRGVIDARDLWYFISITVVFLGFSYLNLIRSKYGNRKKSYRNYQLAFMCLIGIVVLSNIVGLRIPGRIDLTKEKIYTLSSATKEIAGNLPDIVNIDLYASDKLPAQFQPILRETKDILTDYQNTSKGKIKVVYKNPSESSEIAKEATSAGIQSVRFNVVSQEEFQVKEGYLGIAVSYSGKHEVIPFVQSVNDLEYQLSSFLKKLTDENKPKIGIISGHGEKSFSTDYRIISGELKKQFEVEEIKAESGEVKKEELKGEAKKVDTKNTNKKDEAILPAKKFSIPSDIKTLIIAGPTEEYSEEEKNTLSEFLTKGGSAFFLIDGVVVSAQTMEASVNEKNLADYLKNLTGIEVKKDLAYDLRSNETVGLGGGQMRYIVPYPLWTRALKTQNSSPITSKLENIVLPWSSTLAIDQKILDEKGFEKTELFSTTDYAGTQSANFNIDPNQKFSEQGLSKKIMAVALSSKKDKESQSRLVVVGDSDFLSDQFVNENLANFSFGLEAISWLSQESSLSQIRVKNLIEKKLVFKDNSEPNLLKFGNLAFVFLVTSSYGTWRLMRRKKMKERSYEY